MNPPVWLFNEQRTRKLADDLKAATRAPDRDWLRKRFHMAFKRYYGDEA